MSSKSRKEREKEQRREQILDAAEQIFIEKGLESVRMDEVAEKAELSKGTLYLYFKNKNEVALGVYIRGLMVIHQIMADELANPGTGMELMKRMVQVFFRFSDEHPHHFSLLVYFESAGIDTLEELKNTRTMNMCNELGAKLHQYIRRAIQIGIQDGSIRPDVGIDSTAIQILASIRGLIQLSSFHERGVFMAPMLDSLGVGIQRLIDDYFKFLLLALSPDKNDRKS